MGDPRGFLNHERSLPPRRPVPVRLKDWKEVYEDRPDEDVSLQASRCMDCGIPFCNSGCPLGNLIPDWNDLAYRQNWKDAARRLHATNNFPEFTGRLCPAPCEGACVAGINTDPIAIKNIELTIIERAFTEGWVTPVMATHKTGKSVAIVGSGPAGLAAAQQLTRAGHDVTVFERADRIGGLMRYGIPEFKMEKHLLDRRLEQMTAEGTTFTVNAYIGGPAADASSVPVSQLQDDFDVIILSTGASKWRDLPIPGRELSGVYQAMEYLPPANRVQHGDEGNIDIHAKDKNVIVIGGGDTGADCLGTALRQGATSVHQFEIMERPPDQRSDSTPWPTWPLMLRVSSAHQEGGVRLYSVSTTEFVGEAGKLTSLRGHEVSMELAGGRPSFNKVPESDFEMDVDLVFLAMGFTGPEQDTVLEQLGVELDDRGNVKRDSAWQTSADNVFVCGDSGRGQSLIVWAIAEGRSCAAAVDSMLMGSTLLPAPVRTTDRPLV